ncbi:transcriptional regulatory protein [Leptospira ryugenii]|uniref:Transcriptional regulatory protein n=1 Tax=Leptospira ryugenii TaxID=1917863 RepID=A0A2P2E0I1_9LEPT|nr:TetR/AcrR family transcriptional regulator [Leptospira ryugenii]GBF50394.1 transcriptional regulatory protein [Leptospira ryugenii]
MEKVKPKTQKRAYHHGDLYETLIRTAEKWIQDRGMEAFSLRACAKAAGVAHSAPGHYFKDVSEILTEIAARGFERLHAKIEEQKRKAPKESLLYNVCFAYVSFAMETPKLFPLIFHSDRVDRGQERFQRAGELAFRELALAIDPDKTQRQKNYDKLLFVWSQIHGLAMLSIDGPMVPVGGNRKGLDIAPIQKSIRTLVSLLETW